MWLSRFIFVKEIHNIMFRVIHKIAAIFLTMSILLLILNKALYLHTHKLQDGTVVTHAHPFNKTNERTPFKTHHHASVEFEVISHFDLLILLFAGLVFIACLKKEAYRFLFTQDLFPLLPETLQPGRAPPFKP